MRSGTHHAGRLTVFLLVCLIGILCMITSACADTLVLPAGLTVIEEYAFYGDTSITSVVLPDGLEEIGAYAFAGCTNLTKINLPDGVHTIGDNAFEGTECYPLVKAWTTAAETAINARIALEIDFLDPADENKWQIGMYLSFHHNEYCLDQVLINPEATPVTDIWVPDGVEAISERAFEGLSGITGIVLPESLQGIGAYAFDGCSALTDMGLPSDMIWIHEDAFEGTNCQPMAFAHTATATKAIEMKIPLEIDFLDPADENKWQIGMYFSFHDNEYCLDHAHINPEATPVTDIWVPDGVEAISERAFEGLSGITGIVLPESLQGIGAYAFDGCSALTDMGLPSNMIWIHEDAFEGTNCQPMAFAHTATAMKAIEMKIPLEIDFLDPADDNKWQISMYFSFHDNEYCLDHAHINPEATPVTDVFVPEGVESISQEAFAGLADITGVVLPDSLRGIGSRAFDGCEALINMRLPSNMVWLLSDSFDGTNCKPSVLADTATAVKAIEVKVPLEIDFMDPADENKSQIGMYLSFHDSKYILDHVYANSDATPATAIVLPEGIEGIGEFAFHQETQEEIDVFESITIPDSVIWINDNAFDACTNVTLQVHSGSYAETWAIDKTFPYQTITE